MGSETLAGEEVNVDLTSTDILSIHGSNITRTSFPYHPFFEVHFRYILRLLSRYVATYSSFSSAGYLKVMEMLHESHLENGCCDFMKIWFYEEWITVSSTNFVSGARRCVDKRRNWFPLTKGWTFLGGNILKASCTSFKDDLELRWQI